MATEIAFEARLQRFAMDAFHVSRGKLPKKIPRVDETECVGCNLCSLVCPVEECIMMVEVDTGLRPQTWEERTAAVAG